MTTPPLLPWIEVNRGTVSELDNAIAGLRIWQAVTPTALVSTAPGGTAIYRRLRTECPGMTIIPGMKTAARLTEGFDSLTGWRQVARDVAEVADAAGVPYVLLEHETALTPYWTRQATLDVPRYRRAVRQLPAGIDILWYPGVVGESLDNQDFSAVITASADALGRVSLVDMGVSSPRALTYGWSREAKARLEAIATKPPIPLIYVGTMGTRTYWPYTDVPRALGHVDAAEVLLYPGAAAWVAAATAIVGVLHG